MTDALARLRELRRRPFNFLSASQSVEGARLATRALDDMYGQRRLPSYAELEEIVTNPHALAGFHDWCQRSRRFALWTREAIQALAVHLRDGGFERILEIGAGRGDLAWHLAAHGVPVRATDAGPGRYAGYTLREYRGVPVDMWENVERLDWSTAVARYSPDCVLCSWMPPDEDWTPDLRATPSIREIILVWELRGTTGGASAFRRNPGWRAADLVDVEQFLVGRTDEGLPGMGITQYTKATAFRRSESLIDG